jgi:hypothetical protein
MKRREFVRSISLLGTAVATTGFCTLALARRVGRPASPTSVAGVRRRQRRRYRRRVHRNMTVYSLPYGCGVTRVRGRVTYYYCSGIWYRPAYQGTTVVYIVEDIDRGASTEVEFYE